MFILECNLSQIGDKLSPCRFGPISRSHLADRLLIELIHLFESSKRILRYTLEAGLSVDRLIV